MHMERVLAELVSREARGDEALVTTDDIERWTASTQLDRGAFLEALAIELAGQYDQGGLPFEICDEIVNHLFSCTIASDIARPEVFIAVFEAFDEGEYYHGNDRSEDPERLYTRPMIKEVLARRGTPTSRSAPEQ